MRLQSPAALAARIGQEIGLSEWLPVTQDMIDRFADLTDDHQFIHVNPALAAQTPFGGTIAHGFLVLSLITTLGKAAEFALEGITMGVNYGFEKIRMVSPVHTGRRIRGRFVLKELTERMPGQWLAKLGVTIEIEGETRPAVIADWLALQYVRQETP